MQFVGLLAVLTVGALLLSAVGDLPAWGDPNSPASQGQTSRYFIEHTGEKTHVPNLVTAVLADYRGYDTMFETVVIFTAGISIFAILGSLGNGERRGFLPIPKAIPFEDSDSNRIIIGTTIRLLVPVIQLFALYVLIHGHYSPGGGFQGGVIFGASYILIALSGGLPEALKRFPARRFVLFGAIGIILYAGLGLVSLLLGSEFLNYAALAPILPGIDAVYARYHAMAWVELGVFVTVASIMFAIYASLSTNGDLEDGL